MAVTYPKGLSKELAGRLYGRVKVDWSTEPFTYDESRSECREWLQWGSDSVTEDDDDYTQGMWPTLVNVIRRGTDNKVRVFQFSNGLVIEQTT